MLLRLLANLFGLFLLPLRLLRRARVLSRRRVRPRDDRRRCAGHRRQSPLLGDGGGLTAVVARRARPSRRRDCGRCAGARGARHASLVPRGHGERDVAPGGRSRASRRLGGSSSCTCRSAATRRSSTSPRSRRRYSSGRRRSSRRSGSRRRCATSSRALERAGVEPEVFARGRFKSAGEQLVRDSMSDPQREQLGALLDAFYDEVVRALAKGRRVAPGEGARADRRRARTWRARRSRAGLVDGVAYEDELPALLGKEGAPVQSRRRRALRRADARAPAAPAPASERDRRHPGARRHCVAVARCSRPAPRTSESSPRFARRAWTGGSRRSSSTWTLPAGARSPPTGSTTSSSSSPRRSRSSRASRTSPRAAGTTSPPPRTRSSRSRRRSRARSASWPFASWSSRCSQSSGSRPRSSSAGRTPMRCSRRAT